MSDLRRLAEFIHDITWDQLPERVRETAALRVLDLVSVAAGAAKDPLVEAAKRALGQNAFLFCRSLQRENDPLGFVCHFKCCRRLCSVLGGV